jgi:HSP20 family protein
MAMLMKRRSTNVPVRSVGNGPRVRGFDLLPSTRQLLAEFGFNDPWFEQFTTFPTLFRREGLLVPEVDMFETDKEVVVKTPLPGIDPKDIKVECNTNVLTLSGEFKKDEETKDKNYYRREISSGEFYRQLALPTEVKAAEAKASYTNGVLEIHLPKVKAEKVQTVQVPVEAKK